MMLGGRRWRIEKPDLLSLSSYCLLSSLRFNFYFLEELDLTRLWLLVCRPIWKTNEGERASKKRCC
ncbi:hypothetical protein RchiOBHm_Chr6g0254091 [Rosa chinensis]|uniref:Uncharacterized protein n=1 Tax=Rosa chinensis TaxID=74649 RepID=A0A2P6PLJ6_ROSCH|nr:hypothetical protein RchiOBHm_Chr6g0254091 [Rosa chinensis]